ncbi:MAG TPA: hypothetical protein VJ865_15275 [Gemmatimonadaceae bacterium]|nr:hypothetical protein [Gemmatimonadaceae bacterium]
MAGFRYTTAGVLLAMALVSRASAAQQASVSLIHTVVVTVPPRVKVQVAPTVSQSQQVESGRKGLAVKVNATRGWALVVGTKKNAEPVTQWVASGGEHNSSMVVYRNNASQRTSDIGGASDSEPVMLTVVAP